MPCTTSSKTRIMLAAAAIAAVSFLIWTGTAMSSMPRTEIWGAGASDQKPGISIQDERTDGLRLRFELPVLNLTEWETGGETWQELTIPAGGEGGEPGQPARPIFTRLLAIPDGFEARCSATLLEEETRSGLRLRPVLEGNEAVPTPDPAAYGRDGFGDDPWVTIGEPAILRGTRVVPITFAPVRYNPARGIARVARRLEVAVDFRPSGSPDPGAVRPMPPVASFAAIGQELILNNPLTGGKAVAGDGLWLVICKNDSNVLTRLQPLVDWRRRKGHPVYVATTTETGTTKEAIKAFIQNAYDQWENPPEYVVLVGDAGGTYGIPTWHETVTSYQGEGDHPYVQLAGGDLLADAHVGRLSFGTLTELETIVAKTVNYESTPYLDDTAWYTRSCLTGDPYDSGYSTVQVMQWIKTRQLELGYTQIDTVFDYPFVSQMSTDLSRGDTYFFYRGIYGMSGWQNSNTYALSNGWKLPFCVAITCDTGSFESSTSRSEGFLRAGTATTPRGGVGAVGTSTTGTHTRFNNCYMFGVGWGAFYHDAWRMGEAHTWGKLNLYLNYYAAQASNAIAFTYWNNLMGDPAGEIWTGVPQPIAVNHPATIAIGTNSVAISVTKDGAPCPQARVCLYQPGAVETQVVGYTDEDGTAHLAIPPAAAGTFQLTVTKHNCRPYLVDVPVTAGSHVGIAGYQTDDDSAGESLGDSDGLIAPGEWIELPVTIRNYGTAAVGSVSGTLDCDDPFVTVLDATEDFGNVAAGGIAISADDFGFMVSRECPDGHAIRLNLTLTSGHGTWESVLDLEVHAPAATYSVHHFTDAGGNGLLDPGETVGLTVALQNVGDLAAEQARAALVSRSEYITVNDPVGTWPIISPDATQENTTNPFYLSAAAACPDGYLAPMELHLEYAGGVRQILPFQLPVGTAATTDPLGPDRYGYWAYDNTDVGYAEAPAYSWVEISPSLGGDGTQVQLGDYSDYDDKSRTVALPFPFTYYGESYTTATICSNGWITMGATYLTDYRNWTLPSPGGPNGVIAVFWDDLREVNATPGHVYQKYDAAGHRWIVEWSRLRNASGQQTETFQAIFYDPAFHPTETGDGIIEFQYSTIANVDSEDHYATVGLERPDNSDGLTYTYFNRYPSAAPTLSSGRAIRFVPKREAPASVETTVPLSFGFDAATPNPFRPGRDLQFRLTERCSPTLEVFDAQGRLVRAFAPGEQAAGRHAIAWDGRTRHGDPAPNGLYFLRLQAGGQRAGGKILLLND